MNDYSLRFSASIAAVGGAIRWNAGRNGGRVMLEIPEADAVALSWLAGVCREAELTVTIAVSEAGGSDDNDG